MIKILYLLLGVISFYLVLRWDVWDDWKKNSVRHTKEALIRDILLAPSMILLTLAAGINTGGVISTLFMMFFVWWIFFDGWLNKLRGHGWWFTGSIDPDDAKSDTFLKRLPLWGHKILKIGGVLISMGFYFFTLIKNYLNDN